MRITIQSKEFTKQQLYMMTKSPSIISVKHLTDGATLEVDGWLEFEDTNNKGETSELLSIIGKNEFGDTVVWSCQSNTFKDNFFDIDGLFRNEDGTYSEPFKILKLSGKTKADRDYVNCDLFH